jgi:predicted ATPase
MTAVDRITVRGFKSIREMDLELRPINVLVGANGAGKSNFLGVFSLLREIASQRFQRYVLHQGGADRVLHFGRRKTRSLSIGVQCGAHGYEVDWAPTVDDRLLLANERAVFRGQKGADAGVAFTAQPSGSAAGSLETQGYIPPELQTFMKTWRVYHFHDTSEGSPAKTTPPTSDSLQLHANASNLPVILNKLRTHHEATYRRILDVIRLAAPFVEDLVLELDTPDAKALRLRWKHRGWDTVFDVSDLSDGTLRFICLAVLLLQPTPPKTILIDEPELGLHPHAVSLIAGMMQSAAATSQIICATQSVTLVNQFEPADVIVVDRRDDASEFTRWPIEKLRDWLDEYALGDIWEKNVIGGSAI